MEPPWLGLFDRIDRTTTRSFLQPAFSGAVDMDLNPERARECGVDGVDIALPLAAGRLSLALDAQLDRADCYQHVAFPVFGVVIHL